MRFATGFWVSLANSAALLVSGSAACSAALPFKFTGKLAKLTISIEEPKLTPADEKLLREEGQRDNSMSQ